MTKQSKEAKRKAKAKAKKKQILLNEQSLSNRLATAIEWFCEPVLPEYIDDSVKPDIVGRQILWQIGQIAWNIAVTGRKELVANVFQGSKLDAEQQAMVQKEIRSLVRKKYELYPNLRTAVSGIAVHMVAGVPHLKVKLGDTFPETPTPVFDDPEITPESIRALRRTQGMTQVAFAKLLETTPRKVSAWEHGKAVPDEEMKRKLADIKGNGL